MGHVARHGARTWHSDSLQHVTCLFLRKSFLSGQFCFRNMLHQIRPAVWIRVQSWSREKWRRFSMSQCIHCIRNVFTVLANCLCYSREMFIFPSSLVLGILLTRIYFSRISIGKFAVFSNVYSNAGYFCHFLPEWLSERGRRLKFRLRFVHLRSYMHIRVVY